LWLDKLNPIRPFDLGYYRFPRVGPVTPIAHAAGGFGIDDANRNGRPSINSAGLVAISGVNGTDASTQWGVFVGDGGPLTTIASSAPGQPFLLTNNAMTSINSSGMVAFHANVRSGGSGIFKGAGGEVTTIAQPGDFLDQFGGPRINDSGTVVFVGRTKALVNGIFTGTGGALTTIADTSGAFTNFLTNPSINSSGVVAFTANLGDGGDNGGRGIFMGSGGPTTMIADNSGLYNYFNYNVEINDRNTVAFTADLKTGGSGIFTGPDPVVNKVIAVGDSLFGGKVTDVNLAPGGLNNHNEVAFRYILDTKVNGLYVTGLAIASPRTVLANISTRMRVEDGDNVLIGGFIVTGTQTKKLMVRGIGPSLSLDGKLADPTLELHDSTGALIDSNDNWQDAPNRQEIVDSKIPPVNDLESAIVRSVPPGAYTGILRGVNGGTGIGLVEVYDLDLTVDSKLANISTRGLVQTNDKVMIGGFIVAGSAPQKVIVRAIGPSLPVEGKLADPTLELHDGNGGLLETNDNWVESSNKQAIIDSTIPPINDVEPAIVRTLAPGNYTAIVRGANDTTGVALVEVYGLN
jgi:hypothetical protein